MEKLDPKISAWLWDHLIPRLAGIFHELPSSSSYEEVECKVTKPKDSFFLSNLFFASLRFPGGGAERNVVIKLPADRILNSTELDMLFDNEILFYEKLAIKADQDEFPDYYFGGKDSVWNKIMVLEDVRSKGYSVSQIRTSIPLDYTIAGLKAIARFHGNSYKLKEKNPEYFYEIKNKIKDPRFPDVPNERYVQTFNERLSRVPRALRAKNYDKEFTDKIASLFEHVVQNVIMKCVKPIEPLATIIHGDVTINNLLYKVKDDKLHAMLIDFATLMYTTPAIDVSTFLYLSCSPDDIKYRSQDLYKVYYDTLEEYMNDEKVWDPLKYSYEALWKDYERCAIFGYSIMVFFLPMMLAHEKDNNVMNLSLEEIYQINTFGGGEPLSNTFADILINMRENGMLDHYC